MATLVTGATGFIGGRLLARLADPVVLTRDVARAKRDLPGVRTFAWEPEGGPPPAEAFEGVEAVIHLAGEPIAEGRWTAAKKQRIRDSRVLGTRHLVQAMGPLPRRPRVLVSASAVGFYGSRGDQRLDETAPPGDDFLARVCLEWENEASQAGAYGVRVVTPRTGIVLGREGGALAKLLPLFRLGLGGPLGSGDHWWAWIHVDDLVGLFLHAARVDEVIGPMNAVAPHPVTNREFTRALGGAVHRPALIPAPYLALRLALGEVAGMLFASQRAIPEVALRSGYRYLYPELKDALQAIVDDRPAPERAAAR